MYAAVRPALRSAINTRPPARLIRGRRYPQSSSSYRVQPFHASRCLAQTPTPTTPTPPAPDNANSTPVNESEADRKSREDAEAAAPPAQAEAEDTDGLAQKLQRSREQARRYSSALRRSQRRNRAQDLPPIHVPDWFLESRVRLREDAPPRRDPARRMDCALELRHASGDHASLSIPASDYPAAVRAVSQLTKALWKRGMSDEQKKLFAHDFARRMGRADDAALVAALEKGEEPAVAFGQDPDPAPEAGAKETVLREKTLRDAKRISPLLLAEIRATMAAALSAVQPAISHAFPSAKTNLILHSPSNEFEGVLSSAVHALASELGADVVTLQAQDLAQIAGDYLGEGPDPSPHSIRSLGYETYKYGPDFSNEVEAWGKDEPLEEEPDAAADPSEQPRAGRPPIKMHFILKNLSALKEFSKELNGQQSAGTGFAEAENASSNFQPSRNQTHSEIQLEDLKLAALLEALIDANDLKRTRGPSAPKTAEPPMPAPLNETTDKEPQLFDLSFQRGDAHLDFSSALPLETKDSLTFTVNNEPSPHPPQIPQTPKIIHIKDIKELNGTQYGSRILQKLEEIVRKQRNAGESIMLLGTTCSEDLTPEMSASGVQGLQSEQEAGFFRTIVVTPGNVQDDSRSDIVSAAKAHTVESSLSWGEKKKFRTINSRHIQDMLRCLDPIASANIADMGKGLEGLRRFASTFPESYAWSVLTYDEVHRISLTALGLRFLDSNNDQLSWAHVTLAMGLLKASDETKFAYAKYKATEKDASLRDQYREHIDRIRVTMGEEPLRKGSREPKQTDAATSKRQQDLARVKAGANAHEKRLMHGIVNPDQLKTTFDQVHVPKETIEAIRTLTSMSLLRPDAFNYGVLATEKISGALLYGPPGTGKTLLAKAVAKESGSSVLEVSGSQIMDKYVGEGEKNVAAIFSLARKLSPCIVFLDEADAIFGTRDSSRDRTSHRDILNQFLKEWDGLNDLSVFVMVATNRPFDMDDAVIRRLPRRLLVDLPTQEDRKKIMEIHLKGEQLDSSVDIDDLAKRTPLYSGSDLKNVAVFAALACVREENEHAALATAKASADAAAELAATAAAASPTDSASADTATVTAPSPLAPSSGPPTPLPTLVAGLSYSFPAIRTLHPRHFDKALQEVSASISENMSSLNAIKKFDEQYGDRKGRRKKGAYGFGVSAGANEEAARVRT